MKRDWSTEELIDTFTLLPDELIWVSQRSPHNALGLAVLLKFFQVEGRFPQNRREIPPLVLSYLAEQLHLSPASFDRYQWGGRSMSRHRGIIRDRLGFRAITLGDEEALVEWLIQHPIMRHDHDLSGLEELAYRYCADEMLEPPTPERVDRLVRSAISQFEDAFFESIHQRLTSHSLLALDSLIHMQDNEETSWSVFAQLKTDPGPLGLKSVLREVEKLTILQEIELPDGLFEQFTPKLLDKYRQRAAVESPSHFREQPPPIRYTLLAAFCWQRRQEVTDNLIELLIQLIHKIQARAEYRVERDFISDIKQVKGKHTLLYRLAEAILSNPDGVVRDVLFSVVDEQTLQDLVEEYRAGQTDYHAQVQQTMRRSYSHHYRQMLPHVLRVLDFRASNVRYRPVIDALAVVERYLKTQTVYYPLDEHPNIPLDSVVPSGWRNRVVVKDAQGRERINRLNYEVSVLHTLRDRLRHKQIWVVGAFKFRHRELDLLQDFDTGRAAYYQSLHQPLEADTFISHVQAEMARQLQAFNDELPDNPYVQILPKGGGWIKLSPLSAQSLPPQLPYLHSAVKRNWGMTTLLDVFKEADLQVGFTQDFHSAASRTILLPDVRQKRLLLTLYALGTNAGIKQICMGDHGEKYSDLLYMYERFVRAEGLYQGIGRLNNATLAVRQSHIWGEGSMSCASDARKFATQGHNLKTEWHIRYRGRGVMIYWHVEKNSLAIYSQLKSPSNSEVASMIQGLVRHLTDADIKRNFVDTHGQSLIAFGLCYLLGFDLIPRLKGIHKKKLYRPHSGQPHVYPNLHLILTRPIRWEIIHQQYDEMIRIAASILFGTADVETILRRFTRDDLQHPTYTALLELGRAVMTIFLCRYLRSEELRREALEAMNVVESWNSGNRFVFFGNGAELRSSRLVDQEISALSLHLVQNSLVYVNTLMLQHVLAQPGWYDRMTEADWRGLTPLFYEHINPYGTFSLKMDDRIPFLTD